MSKLSRRQLVIAGVVTAAGAGGLAVAAKIAGRYGLVPPDSGGIYGPGETLTYAAQRLLTRHSLAREFSRSQISAKPLMNEVAPLGDNFQRLQKEGFADWRLNVAGMVARPASFSVAELKSFPRSSHITMISARKAGPISPNGRACHCRMCCNWSAHRRKPRTWFIGRSSRTGGRAWTWPMRCIRKRCWPMK
jgi:hypothetical protein